MLNKGEVSEISWKHHDDVLEFECLEMDVTVAVFQ